MYAALFTIMWRSTREPHGCATIIPPIKIPGVKQLSRISNRYRAINIWSCGFFITSCGRTKPENAFLFRGGLRQKWVFNNMIVTGGGKFWCDSEMQIIATGHLASRVTCAVAHPKYECACQEVIRSICTFLEGPQPVAPGANFSDRY